MGGDRLNAQINIGIELEWKGKGENEKGVIKSINLEKAKKLISYSSNKKSYPAPITNWVGISNEAPLCVVVN